MRKDILIVDWLLIVVFALIIIFKIFGVTLIKVIQPMFLILCAIHVIQHWKFIVSSLKRLKR